MRTVLKKILPFLLIAVTLISMLPVTLSSDTDIQTADPTTTTTNSASAEPSGATTDATETQDEYDLEDYFNDYETWLEQDSALNVKYIFDQNTAVYDEYQELYGGGISTFALTTDSGANWANLKDYGFVWSYDANGNRNSFTFTDYNGNTHTHDEICIIALDTNHDSRWSLYDLSYCIEPGTDYASVYDDKNKVTGVDSTWGQIPTARQRAIGLTLLYGAPNKHYYAADNSEHPYRKTLNYAIATQIIIHEFAMGFRDATPPFTLQNDDYIDMYTNPNHKVTWAGGEYTSNDGELNKTDIKACYDEIINDITKRGVMPSFVGAGRPLDHATIKLTRQTNGTYSTTVTDTNNVLSRYTFTNTDGVTFTKNGNKLTITTTSATVPETVFSASKTVPSPERSQYLIWNTSSDAQENIQLISAADDPVSVYFELEADEILAPVKIKKTSTDGHVNGITFTIKNNTTGETITRTTNTSGEIEYTAIVGHSLTITEQVPTGYVNTGTNPQTITVADGGNAVSFSNKPIVGYIQIIKVDSETGETLSGAAFQAKNNATNATYPLTHIGNGVYKTAAVPYGTYTVTETAAPEGYVKSTNSWRATIDVDGETEYIGTTGVIPSDPNRKGAPNEPIRGHIRLTKYDVQTGRKVSGATYVATDSQGVNFTLTEVSPGVYEARNLYHGTATVRETIAPAGYEVNQTVYRVTITDDDAFHDVTESVYDGVIEYPTPGKASVSKLVTNGIRVDGYALSLWSDGTDMNGEIPPVTHYLKSGTDGRFYVTNSNYDTVTGNRDYTIDGLYNGKYKITELISSSAYRHVYVQSIRIVVKDRNNATVKDINYDQSQLTATTVNGVVNYATPEFDITGMSGGGSMEIIVINRPIPGTATITKSTTDEAYLDGYALTLYNSNRENDTIYLRSEDDGDFYITDSDFTEVVGTKTYTIPNIYDGNFTITELIGDSVWHHERLESITLTITDKNGHQTYTRTFSGDELTSQDMTYALSNIPLSGINGGGNLDIQILNTPVPGELEIKKVNHIGTNLSDVTFLLEWSRDGQVWQPVTYNQTDYITVGGCTSPVDNGCLTTTSTGIVKFTGLHPMMKYRVTETATQTGYQLLVDYAHLDYLHEADDYKTQLTVVNNPTFQLTEAGSTGTMVIGCISGIAFGLLLTTGVILFTSRRKRRTI